MFAQVLGAQQDIEIVAVATSLAEANAVEQANSVDVVLLDQKLPDGLGTDAVEQLRRAYGPQCKILMVSASENTALIEHALRAGCSGYVTKSSSASQLIEAIHAVHHGAIVLSPA